MSSRPMPRLIHNSSSHGCSCSICSCSSSHSSTTVWYTGTVLLYHFSSPAHALWEGVIILFFLFFSSIGGVGERSSFLLFWEVSSWFFPSGEEGFCVMTGSTGCLRGRPPLAPLARFKARRCRLSSIAGDNRAKASLRPELLRYTSVSSPAMRAARALNSRPSSLCLSEVDTVIIIAGSMSMLSVFFISKRGLLMVFEFFFVRQK